MDPGSFSLTASTVGVEKAMVDAVDRVEGWDSDSKDRQRRILGVWRCQGRRTLGRQIVLVRGSYTDGPGETKGNITHSTWGIKTDQTSDGI